MSNTDYKIGSSGKKKELHTYQFSYDASTLEIENPVQDILLTFLRNNAIDTNSGFSIHSSREDKNATIVRPVESTWIFNSNCELNNLHEIIEKKYGSTLSYVISEVKDNDPYIAYLRSAKLNPLDDELTKALKTLSEENQKPKINTKPYFKAFIFAFMTILGLLGVNQTAWADNGAGVWSNDAWGVTFTINGSEQSKMSNNTGFSTWNIGSVNSLVFSKYWFKTWQDHTNGKKSNICGGKIYYRIYKGSSSSASFSSNEGSTSWGTLDNNKRNNSHDNNNLNVNALSGLTESGTYTIEWYFRARGNVTSDSGCDEQDALCMNNGGGNYKATFSVSVDPTPGGCDNCQTFTK